MDGTMMLQGRTALVTGGGDGIGRATARAMAREGAHVTVTDRDGAAAEATVGLIQAAGGQAMARVCDVTDTAQVLAAIEAAAAPTGRLDCAFNNAGVAPHQVGSLAQRMHEWSDAAFDRMIAINLRSVFVCMKHELTRMLGQGGGAIVNTASIAGLIGLHRATGYVAAKHAVVGLTRTAALEYAGDGIRVNAICPGFVATRLTALAREVRGAEILSHTPLGRFAEPEEIAELAVWLFSERASYVTGAAYAIDGGWTAM